MDGFKKLPKMADGGSLRSSLGMRELVGKPTGKFSKAGKPMFRTPEGEDVSEKSVTLPQGNKFVNVPSIQKGIRLSNDEISDQLNKKRLSPTSTHDTLEEAVTAAKARSGGLKRGGSVKPGLYANIAAKRERIKRGSGEKMRKPGDPGAPTSQAFKDSAKTAKK